MTAILFVSHGSQHIETQTEIEHIVKQLKEQTRIPLVKAAYLEISAPSIPNGIADCVHEGATHILIVLNFLNSGRHVKVDIPRIITTARQNFPNVTMTISPPIGQHPKIINLFCELIEQSISQ